MSITPRSISEIPILEGQYRFTYGEPERSLHRDGCRPGVQPYIGGQLGFWHAVFLMVAGFSCHLLQCKSERQVLLPTRYLKEVTDCAKPRAGNQSKVVCQTVFLSQIRVSAYWQKYKTFSLSKKEVVTYWLIFNPMWTQRHSFPEGAWLNHINVRIFLLCQAMAPDSQRLGIKCLNLKWSSNTFVVPVSYPNSNIEVGPTTPVPHSSPSFNAQQSTWRNNTSGSLLGYMIVQEVLSPEKCGSLIYLEVNLQVVTR